MAYNRYKRSNRRLQKSKQTMVIPANGMPYYPRGGSIVGAPKRMGPKVRTKQLQSRSYTSTIRKRRRTSGKAYKTAENSSMSTNKIGGRILPKSVYQIAKLVAPRTIANNSSGNISCTQGRQQILAFEYNNLSELQYIKSIISSTDRNIRLILQTGITKLLLRNQTNTNCRLSIYDIVTKRDSQNTTYDTPIEAWQKSSTDNSDVNQLYYIGQTPYKSAEFRKFFAVNKVTYANLEPGMQHEHIVHHKYNKIIDTTRWDNTTGTSLAGLTRFIMIVFYGHLAHDTAAPASVTTSPITLDWMYSEETTYKWISNQIPGVTYTNNLPTTIVNLDQMAENQDVDADVITA